MKKSVQSCAESGFKGNKQQIVVARNIGGRNWSSPRLQNSPYFYVFKYARTVKKKKVWTEAENRERDYTLVGRVRLERLTRVRFLGYSYATLNRF